MAGFPEFTGNCPGNVSKDAKYGVKSGDNGPVVGLIYSTDDDERWHTSTESHPELVRMVNAVKLAHNGKPNGPFYVNEYKQVLVPAGKPTKYYLAGTYPHTVRFEFEGKTISGEPVNLDGKPLLPGDTWVGSRAGIPYVLSANVDDIYYEIEPRPDVTKKVRLSARRGKSVARQVAQLLSMIKGTTGGRFYVNEFRAVFSPVKGENGYRWTYFGLIDPTIWFPDPMTSTSAIALA